LYATLLLLDLYATLLHRTFLYALIWPAYPNLLGTKDYVVIVAAAALIWPNISIVWVSKFGKIGYVPLKDCNFRNIQLKDHLFAI
jgi:hypothetical protein